MPINSNDMNKLEIKYRKVLKCMMSLPDCTPSALVYLTIGILPAEAQRDLEILSLLGQLAMADPEIQNVLMLINQNLAFFYGGFAGWSGLVRRTAEKYGLPDPLLYLQHPWRPDRWRSHCQTVITKQWEQQLKAETEPKTTAQYVDLESLSISTPMRLWQQAGLNSAGAKEATLASWMYCGVYFTRERMHKFKKIGSPECACGLEINETLPHFLLNCQLYDKIRQQHIPQLINLNTNLTEICDNEYLLMLSILDPVSSKLPEKKLIIGVLLVKLMKLPEYVVIE